jgi:hypothetical protein
MSIPLATDIFLLRRGSTNYKVPYSKLTTIADDDLMLVQRGDTQYKVTGAFVKAYLLDTPPIPNEPWTPADMETGFWGDASDASKIIVDGSNRISQWTNKAAAGSSKRLGNATQGTTNNQPVYAAPAIVIDRTSAPSREFTISGLAQYSGSQEFGLFACTEIKQPTAIFGFSVFNWGIGIMDEVNLWALGDSNLIAFSINNGDDSNQATAFAMDEISFFACVFDGTKSANIDRIEMRVNGTSMPTSEFLVTPYSIAAGLPDVGRIGGSHVPNFGIIGHYYQLIIAPGDVLAANAERLEGWVAHKYGQASLLPANHPYKNAPPTK